MNERGRTMIKIPDGVTREELIACIDRELGYRERVYPRRVERGLMTYAESARELRRMRAVRLVVEQLPPTQPALFPGAGE